MFTRKPVKLFITGCLLLGTGALFAQNYPAKPIRMVVAFAPGGSPDILGRILAQKLSERLGQPVIVDNRPGATGNIGAEAVAKAPPDGYTIFLATSSLAISPGFYKTLPFDPVASFVPVTLVASQPLFLLVNAESPAKSIAELIALAKAKPGGFNYASPGNGSPQHVSGELLAGIAGLKLVHVPYKSGGAMVAALLSGEVQLMFLGLSPVVSHVKAGKLRVIGVASTRRSPAAPEVPTFAEAGLPEIVADNWLGVLAPAGTPKGAIDKLHAEIVNALREPEMTERFAQQGAEVNTSANPDGFAAFLKAEIAKWAKVVAGAGIQAQ